MVFSSVPYLDPPNWQQAPSHHHQQAGVITSESHHHNSQLPPPPPPPPVPGVGGGGIRPGSMTERARLAKIPQPESALKCPRCESTNTKFCYFNNYSLSQPRHFCKTCRRYWTRGGALRNVPVGGGCRRNKRSKGNNRSKSPSVVAERQHGSSSSSRIPPQVAVTGCGTSASDMDFQGSTGLVEQWRSLQQVQQFPFLTSLEQSQTGLYPFESDGVEPPPSYAGHHQFRSKPLESAITQLANVKMEDSQQGLNLSRNFLGISGNDHQYWGTATAGNSWTDLSGFIKEKSSHR
ncbi:hypothetical protein V6Z11_A10G257400 [Gossypium hirsutum]